MALTVLYLGVLQWACNKMPASTGMDLQGLQNCSYPCSV